MSPTASSIPSLLVPLLVVPFLVAAGCDRRSDQDFPTAVCIPHIFDHAPDAVPTSRVEGTTRLIQEREYWASENGQGLQAPNRRHGLRTYFEPMGIRIEDRSGADDTALLTMRLRAFGREGELLAVGPGRIRSDGPRIEIQRERLLEWYVNAPSGVEQGFTLPERPAGTGALILEIELAGGASAEEEGDSLCIRTADAQKLAYGKLAAVDAGGSLLPARLMAASPHRIRLRVDDANATYPIVIDPLITNPAFSTRIVADQEDALLGYSVSGAGDVNGDGYDDIIVGAYLYDSGQNNEGAAFIFMGSANGITDIDPGTAATRIESDQTNAQLGISVSSAGDVNGDGYDDVIVGAHLYGDQLGQDSEGAAFVFLGSASGIANGNPGNAHARLEGNQPNARLGTSVSSAGDVDGDGYDDVIVGAILYDAGETNEGAAFVFLGSASGIPDGDPSSADTQIEADQAFAFLGISVSGAGDVNGDGYDDVIVGSRDYAEPPNAGGAAFVFLGSASGIPDGNPSTADTRIEGDQADAELGISVSDAGDVNGDGYDDIVVGAFRYAAGGNNDGAAFVFLGSASGIPDGNPSTADTRIEGDQLFTQHLGVSVSGAGNVNGDAYDDILVGDIELQLQSPLRHGAVFLFLGRPTGIPNGGAGIATARLEGEEFSSAFGSSVSGAGDIDGDGLDDVVLGDSLYSLGHKTNEGAAYVFLGSDISVPEPGFLLGLASASGLLAVFSRRRRGHAGIRARAARS